MSLVSCKEMDCSDAVMTTQGSLSEMEVERPRKLGHPQSSMARQRRLAEGWSGLDVPMLHRT